MICQVGINCGIPWWEILLWIALIPDPGALILIVVLAMLAGYTVTEEGRR